MNNLRTIYRINKDNTKTQVRLSEIKTGQFFEVYESDTNEYLGMFLASSDGELNLDNGSGGIYAELVNPNP